MYGLCHAQHCALLCPLAMCSVGLLPPAPFRGQRPLFSAPSLPVHFPAMNGRDGLRACLGWACLHVDLVPGLTACALGSSTLDVYQRGSKRWGHLRRVVSTVLLQDTRISGCSTSALGDGGGGDAGGMSAHTTLFERVRASYKEEDLLVSAAVAHKQQCSVADLGADTRLMGCDLSEAVGKMRSLYSLPCTLDKVTVLRQVMLAINQGVERAIAAGAIPATVMVGSDDLLPLVIYVLVQSCVDNPAVPAGAASAASAASAGGWLGAWMARAALRAKSRRREQARWPEPLAPRFMPALLCLPWLPALACSPSVALCHGCVFRKRCRVQRGKRGEWGSRGSRESRLREQQREGRLLERTAAAALRAGWLGSERAKRPNAL